MSNQCASGRGTRTCGEALGARDRQRQDVRALELV
jgi:hypothetical protein